VYPRVLVTGAAGYIGTHIVLALLSAGWSKDDLLGVDDFRTSAHSSLLDEIQFVEQNVQNIEQITKILVDYKIDTIIHLAGNRFARLSLSDPYTSYSDNLTSVLAISESAKRSQLVKNIIFSSSCAVYGSSTKEFDEDALTLPISPYGRSKLWGEQILIDNWKSGGALPVILRYFNVVGYMPPAREDRNSNGLVGAVFRSIQTGEPIRIFGKDFDTVDGTAVRDLVSVRDIADAHAAILTSSLTQTFRTPRIYNLGSGLQVSVLQFVAEIERFLDRKLAIEFVDKNPADPATVKANTSRFEHEFNWRPCSSLVSIIASIGFDQI
jgi:UDP-glucose 4-epimerase